MLAAHLLRLLVGCRQGLLLLLHDTENGELVAFLHKSQRRLPPPEWCARWRQSSPLQPPASAAAHTIRQHPSKGAGGITCLAQAAQVIRLLVQLQNDLAMLLQAEQAASVAEMRAAVIMRCTPCELHLLTLSSLT